MRRKWLRLLASGCLVSACVYVDGGLEVHAEPGSRADSLVFHAFVLPDSVQGGGSISSVTVWSCAATENPTPLWRIERTQRPFWRRANSGTHFRYGSVPSAEWRTVQAARALAPGCYVVRTPGDGIGGRQEVLLSADGRVRNVDAALRDSLLAGTAEP